MTTGPVGAVRAGGGGAFEVIGSLTQSVKTKGLPIGWKDLFLLMSSNKIWAPTSFNIHFWIEHGDICARLSITIQKLQKMDG